MNIGSKIRELRHQCGLTQEELADRCELTKGYISQLENDLTSPSIATLLDILAAVGSNVNEFFSETVEEKVVFGNEDYIEKITEDSKLLWLVPNSQKNEMEPIILELNPKCSTDKDMAHEGEEFGYILEGKVSVHVGSKAYTVSAGGSFYFQSGKQHYIENISEVMAKILWISSPPNF